MTINLADVIRQEAADSQSNIPPELLEKVLAVIEQFQFDADPSAPMTLIRKAVEAEAEAMDEPLPRTLS